MLDSDREDGQVGSHIEHVLEPMQDLQAPVPTERHVRPEPACVHQLLQRPDLPELHEVQVVLRVAVGIAAQEFGEVVAEEQLLVGCE